MTTEPELGGMGAWDCSRSRSFGIGQDSGLRKELSPVHTLTVGFGPQNWGRIGFCRTPAGLALVPLLASVVTQL